MERRYLTRLVDAWLAELLADVPGVMLVGPRSCGKTTSAQRLATTVLRLDQRGVGDAVEATPMPCWLMSTRPCSSMSGSARQDRSARRRD